MLLKRRTIYNSLDKFSFPLFYLYRIVEFITFLTLSLSMKVFGRSLKETLLTYFLTVARSFIAPMKGISWKVFGYRGFLPHQGTTARCLSIGNGVYLSHRFSLQRTFFFHSIQYNSTIARVRYFRISLLIIYRQIDIVVTMNQRISHFSRNYFRRY